MFVLNFLQNIQIINNKVITNIVNHHLHQVKIHPILLIHLVDLVVATINIVSHHQPAVVTMAIIIVITLIVKTIRLKVKAVMGRIAMEDQAVEEKAVIIVETMDMEEVVVATAVAQVVIMEVRFVILFSCITDFFFCALIVKHVLNM